MHNMRAVHIQQEKSKKVIGRWDQSLGPRKKESKAPMSDLAYDVQGHPIRLPPEAHPPR